MSLMEPPGLETKLSRKDLEKGSSTSRVHAAYSSRGSDIIYPAFSTTESSSCIPPFHHPTIPPSHHNVTSSVTTSISHTNKSNKICQNALWMGSVPLFPPLPHILKLGQLYTSGISGLTFIAASANFHRR